MTDDGMDPKLAALIEPAARMGTGRFSGWNAPLFESYARALAPPLWEALRRRFVDSPHVQTVIAAYIQLLGEGIGNGYWQTEPQHSSVNLMEHCLRGWVATRLAALPVEQHLPFLANMWNLLEGLVREPRWVNSYVLARCAELDAAPSLEAFLIRVLKPLFEPAAPSQWQGPFEVNLLSTRTGSDEFLPGDMHLVAPAILAVKDRRRGECLGFVLRKKGQSELAGVLGETAPYIEEPGGVVPHWRGPSLSFGSQQVTLPFLQEPYRWLQVRAGFIVASAVDSQKLWIVESAT